MSFPELIPVKPPDTVNKENEIDLLALLEHLFAARKEILAIAFAFIAMGLIASLILPQKWTSQAIITPPEKTQLIPLRETLARMQALDVEVKGTRVDVFNYFIKEFGSRTLFRTWLLSSPAIMQTLTEEKLNVEQMHRAIVSLAEQIKMKNDVDAKHPEAQPYSSWTLSFTGRDPEHAQWVLREYTKFVVIKVQTDLLNSLKDQLHFKIDIEKEKLNLAREALNNARDAKIARLKYALEIANAAGIKKPVYSKGEKVQDDPDYSIALGSDGLNAKLKVEKSLTDTSSLSPEILDQEYHLAQLNKININEIAFEPFKYLLKPSLPVKHDGPGKMLIVVLAGLLGFSIACGSVLLRQAWSARRKAAVES